MIKSAVKPRSFAFIILSVLLMVSVLLNTGFMFEQRSKPHPIDLSLPYSPEINQTDTANLGAGDDGDEDEDSDSSEPVDVIRNGSFEERDSDPMNGVALEWQAYSNGQAQFGWYDETWPEAVNSGEHAQLMEIFLVDGNILDRAIAIYQTVNVVPSATYDLTINALMRTDAPLDLRNKDEYEMSWGVDYSGQGDYDNVEEWVHMPLTEQLRLGSHGEIPDNNPLFYEVITGTVQTRESNQLTLFIRGVKKFPTGTEVNYDVDEVSLVGPKPGTTVIITPSEPTSTETQESHTGNLPDTGRTLPQNLSIGALILGGLVIVILGAGATANLLFKENQ